MVIGDAPERGDEGLTLHPIWTECPLLSKLSR